MIRRVKYRTRIKITMAGIFLLFVSLGSGYLLNRHAPLTKFICADGKNGANGLDGTDGDGGHGGNGGHGSHGCWWSWVLYITASD